MANAFPIKSDKPKPPALDAPVAKKAAILLIGPKHEKAEPPQKEVGEETAVAKLAYVKGILRDALMACGEDEDGEEEDSASDDMGQDEE